MVWSRWLVGRNSGRQGHLLSHTQAYSRLSCDTPRECIPHPGYLAPSPSRSKEHGLAPWITSNLTRPLYRKHIQLERFWHQRVQLLKVRVSLILLQDWEQALVWDTFHLWLSTLSTQGVVPSTPWNVLLHSPGSPWVLHYGTHFRIRIREFGKSLSMTKGQTSNQMLGFWVPLSYNWFFTFDSVGIWG